MAKLRPALARHLFRSAYRSHAGLVRMAHPDFGHMGRRILELREVAGDGTGGTGSYDDPLIAALMAG